MQYLVMSEIKFVGDASDELPGGPCMADSWPQAGQPRPGA